MKWPPVEKEQSCHGFYGFGGGVLQARGVKAPDGASYCSAACPIKGECWDAHRKRVDKIMPAVAAEFKKLVDRFKGNGRRAVAEWARRYKTADPYSVVLAGNMEDGLAVGAGMTPKDRGDFTLPWPFGLKS